MTVFLVIQYRLRNPLQPEAEAQESDYRLEIQGVFDSREKAESVCLTRFYVVIPLEMNENFPHENDGVEIGYFPKAISAGIDPFEYRTERTGRKQWLGGHEQILADGWVEYDHDRDDFIDTYHFRRLKRPAPEPAPASPETPSGSSS